ncbi:MAG: hypothetical protein KGZ77_03025 [Rhodobacteraceae bacterium]|nr:hypothetical protein [Paracoccaceae bacterium]
MKVQIHTIESLAKDYNSEVVVPMIWQPPRFDRPDWMWIKSVAQADASLDLAIRDVKVGTGESAKRLSCMHRTQPRRNFTVFYRRLAVHSIMVVGVGRHNGANTKYTVDWADGRSNRIDLKKTVSSAEQYLVNPIGGVFGFETMDPVLNTFFMQATHVS